MKFPAKRRIVTETQQTSPWLQIQTQPLADIENTVVFTKNLTVHFLLFVLVARRLPSITTVVEKEPILIPHGLLNTHVGAATSTRWWGFVDETGGE